MNTQMLSELFGGAERYKALKCLFESPSRDFGARDLASAAGIDPGNASRWLRRWAQYGLLEKKEILNRPRYSVSPDPALAHLRLFFQQDSEVVRVLREQLSELGDRVIAAAIFGSTARGTDGADSDIDLLLVTKIPRVQAQASFKPAGRQLKRPVNVTTFEPDRWREAVASGNPFALELLGDALIALKGDLNGIAQTG
ncbi:nucleotidyltransferase domain-containing protein [Achromobacter aloeverae]